MKVSVVVPALDEADRIAAAVRSALSPAPPSGEGPPGEARSPGRGGGEAGPHGVEVWVVDGGSRDATLARAREAGARTLSAPRGRAVQLQAGVRASEGDVLLFLHADTRLPAGWREALEAALARPGVVGGAFRLRFAGRGARLRFIEWGTALRVRVLGLPYGDQALFARRSALEAVGGVPQAPIMEDLDLVRALRSRGRLAVLPLAVETSPRRYGSRPLRHMLANWAALLGWRLGLDRRRLAAWYARGAASGRLP